MWREKREVRIFGKGKCKLIAKIAFKFNLMRIFGKGKWEFIANFSATMVTSLPSLSVSLSLSLSLSLSPKVPHAQYRKRFRASYNGEGPRSKFEREDGQTDGQKWPKISGDDAARPAWVMVPGVSSSRLRPDSDQSRIWCRARPWLGCDSLNELTWVSFVVHRHLTIFFFFCRFVSVVWQDSDRVQI